MKKLLSVIGLVLCNGRNATCSHRLRKLQQPLDKFKSVPNAQQYLKPGMTFDALVQLALKQSDLDVFAKSHHRTHGRVRKSITCSASC